ncbi:MAG: long-chain fatty acid--CoA ligase [Candidatus Aminicenantes bacterium]|nr:long-chain fatty acid--CoA ligase [Candidatus Aminicenantes bacterium]MBM3310164.1 long-chain fatty acid--CoA ligase [Candidatus Aminicenantes bacterium]
MIETLSQIPANFLRNYEKPDLMLAKAGGRYAAFSSREVYDRIKGISLGLRDLGCRPGDKLCLLSENRPEWVWTDLAHLGLGGITVPIYPTLVPEQIRYIIDDSDAKVVVCSSPELWAKVAAVRKDLAKVSHFVMMASEAPEGVLTLRDLEERGRRLEAGRPGLYEDGAAGVKPEDLASIIYTSGTTGLPKGVMLTHGNFLSNVKALDAVTDFHAGDTILSFLPLSHVLERMTTFAFLYKGCSIAYAESIETVAQNLLEVRPTIMICVPRLFEKMHAKIMENVRAGSPLKKKIFFWGIRVGTEASRRSLRGEPLGAGLRLRRGLARRLVHSKILAKTGGRVKFFVSGGAPLSKDIAEFFHAVGLVILEGYGLTETAPVVACNTFDRLKFGTVGRPVPGVEVMIAEDGEILARGPNVMKGYYKKEAETDEALAGGWFHTGDVGVLDEEGFLTITDRKKDLIVTAGGKNVAPQPIENMIKRSPYIAAAVVLGSRRKFVSAIIVPDFEKLAAYAREGNIPFDLPFELARRADIRDFLLGEIDRMTPNLAPYEKIKKIIVLDRDFDLESEELTPTLKIKRGKVEEKFKDLIDGVYRE